MSDERPVPRWQLPSQKARAYLRNIETAAHIDTEPTSYGAQDLADLLQERDLAVAQLENAVAPVLRAAEAADAKLHQEIGRRFTREEVWLAMERASDADVTWDTMAEREEVFADILAKVRKP